MTAGILTLSACIGPVDSAQLYSSPDRHHLFLRSLDGIERRIAAAEYHEIDMYGGRLSKLPAEWAWNASKKVTPVFSNTRTHFRAFCPTDVPGQTKENCDPVLLNRHRVCDDDPCTTYTDYIIRNNNAAVGYGATTTNAQISSNCPFGKVCYNYLMVRDDEDEKSGKFGITIAQRFPWWAGPSTGASRRDSLGWPRLARRCPRREVHGHVRQRHGVIRQWL